MARAQRRRHQNFHFLADQLAPAIAEQVSVCRFTSTMVAQRIDRDDRIRRRLEELLEQGLTLPSGAVGRRL